MLPGRVVRGKKNPLHFKLPVRLRRARKQSQLSCSALALQSGVAKSGISQLESNRWFPRINTVERLAKALNVSPAWLAFGLEHPANGSQDGGLRCEQLGQRVKEQRTARALSPQELGRRSETSGNEVRAVESGTMPSLATIEKLAKALGVGPGWLAFGIGSAEPPMHRRGLKQAQPDPAHHHEA